MSIRLEIDKILLEYAERKILIQDAANKLHILYLKDKNINLAEQQLLGYYMSKIIDISELIISMNLTKEEWERIKKEYPLEYMTEDDKDMIDSCIIKRT